MPQRCAPDSLDLGEACGRKVVGAFDGGLLTTDAGAVLLSATDKAIGLLDRFTRCFTDGRDPTRTVHDVRTLVGQRAFGLCLGYEDLVDHDQLRHDPLLGALLGRLRVISTAAIKRSESMKPHRLTFRAPWESPPRVRASGWPAPTR